MPLSRTFGSLLVALLVACKTQSQEPAATDAGAAPAPSVAASGAPTPGAGEQPLPAANAAIAAIAPAVEQAVDGGADAGSRKLRRLTSRDGGAAAAEGAVTAPETAAAPAEPRKAKKVVGSPSMSDDQPYGGSAASGAPVLKKTPLPSEDPWGAGGAK